MNGEYKVVAITNYKRKNWPNIRRVLTYFDHEVRLHFQNDFLNRVILSNYLLKEYTLLCVKGFTNSLMKMTIYSKTEGETACNF